MDLVCIDFDGTIVEHRYPAIGKPVPGAIAAMKHLQKSGFKIILWTMRSGEELDQAVIYVKSQGIELYGINENPDQSSWTQSPKAYAQYYIDDAAVGCPLTINPTGRPYVNWVEVMRLLPALMTINER